MRLGKDQSIKLKTLISGALLLFFFGMATAQKKEVDKEQLKQLKKAQAYLSEAVEDLVEENFTDAEVNFRKSIALNPSEETGKFNLGNAYYNKDKNDEAMRRFGQASSISESKVEKHKAFHNLGNTFMNAKNYQEAVEAYKNALRNNPTDDETRYNLALAKEMLEKNPPQGGDGEDEKEDEKENEDEKQNEKDNGDGNDKESDDGEKKEDKGDKEDEEQKGDNEKEEGKPDEQKEDKQPKQQPVPGQLSPQQIKNLLEAMNNEEKKVQEKINAKKQKGAKVKSNKDW